MSQSTVWFETSDLQIEFVSFGHFKISIFGHIGSCFGFIGYFLGPARESDLPEGN